MRSIVVTLFILIITNTYSKNCVFNTTLLSSTNTKINSKNDIIHPRSLKASTNMLYTSSIVEQTVTSDISKCSNTEQLIQIAVNTTGSNNPLSLTQINLDFSNSTNISDLDSYAIYYTGGTNTFAATTSFTTGAVASTSINATGAQTLAEGVNYFWLAININTTSTEDNIIDAEIPAITINNNQEIPSITNPVGNRVITGCKRTPGGVTSSNPTVWIKANQGIGVTAGNVSSVANSAVGSTITASLPSDLVNPIAYNTDGYNFNPKLTFDIGYLNLSNNVVTSAVFGVCALEDLTREYTHLVTHKDISDGPTVQGLGTSAIHGGSNGTNATLNWTGFINSFNNLNVWKYNANDVSNGAVYPTEHTIISGAVSTTNIYSNVLFGGQKNTSSYNGGRDRDWVGDASEIIIFSQPITANERIRVESYLAIKYGLTLGVNGTSMNYLNSANNVIWNATSNTGFAYDIAGIMRDDDSYLSQVKSHTENHTSGVRNDILTIAHGTSFTKSAKAVSSFTADKSALVWGHNNLSLNNTGSADIGVTENAETIEGRFNRVWKAEETGTVGAVIMEFDFNALIQVGSWSAAYDLSSVRLLVDEDGTFATNATSIAPTSVDNVNNKAYFTHNFDGGSGMAKGFFFTIGSTDLNVTPLPVAHLSSSINCENKTINWTTTSEMNTSHFVIESLDEKGNITSTTYEDAVGNSNTATNYTILDRLKNPYYTIEVVDLDGKREKFGPFRNDCNNKQISVYPNPTVHVLNISGISKNTAYTISTLSGQSVKSGLTDGKIETNELSTGVYLLIIDGQTHKIIKK